MEKYTLDTNCLIALAKPEPDSEHVRLLVRAFRARQIELAIPAIAALERKPGGRYLEHFDEFRAWLVSLAVEDVPLVHAISHYGLGFFGVGYIPNEDMIDLERRIHQVLHPEVEFSLADFCEAHGQKFDTEHPPRRWRNAKCDVQALWSHIHHGRSSFITSDRDFLRSTKVPQLTALGAGRIVSPSQAVEALVHAA